jgi:hypothetical protein
MICLHVRDKSQQNKNDLELFEFTCTDNVHVEGLVHIHFLAHLTRSVNVSGIQHL